MSGAGPGSDTGGPLAHDEPVTSPKLLLAAGSVAASLAGIGPAVTHGASSAPVRAGSAGVTVSATDLRAGAAVDTSLTVPAGSTQLVGAAAGSPVLASRVHLTVTRSSDGATLFTGSLATFHTLPVRAGTGLVVSVQRPAGYAGLKARAVLSWS